MGKKQANHKSIDIVVSAYTKVPKYPNNWVKLDAYVDVMMHIIETYGNSSDTYTYALEKSSGCYLNRLQVFRFPLVVSNEELTIDIHHGEIVHTTGWMRVDDFQTWYKSVRSILVDVFNELVPTAERIELLNAVDID